MDESYSDHTQITPPDLLKHHDADLGFIILTSTKSGIKIELFSVDEHSCKLKYHVN